MYVSKICPQPDCKNKYRVVLEDSSSFLLYGKELKRFELAEEKDLPDEKLREIYSILYKRGKERAFYLLQSRAKSTEEMRQSLHKNGYPQCIVEKIINMLYEYDLLNDLRYATDFVQSKRLKSRNQLIRELRLKGIDKEIITEVLAKNGENDLQVLRMQIKKKLRGKIFDEKEKQKCIRSFSNRGFAYEDIRQVLYEMRQFEQI